jgi:hypothetical protein
MKRRYLLNRTSGTLHKLPASESCNTDQVESRLYFADRVDAATHLRFRRLCARCFKRDFAKQ